MSLTFSCNNKVYNCSDYLPNYVLNWACFANNPNDCNEAGDSDIAGLGVLLAFMITAYLNFLIAWVGYLFQARKDEDGAMMKVHVLDAHFLDWLWSICAQQPTLSATLRKVIERITLILSDQFLVTGIAVLVTGYIKSCNISIYHFEIVTWLGWLSSNGHQIALTSIRLYFQDHQMVLRYRAFAMAICFLLLLTAVNLAGAQAALIIETPHTSVDYDGYVYNPGRPYAYDAPARCTWTSSAFTAPAADVVFATIVLVLGFVSRVVRLFDASSNLFENWLRKRPGKFLRRLGEVWLARADNSGSLLPRLWWRIATGAVITIYVFGKAFYDCIGSTLNQLIWLSFSLFYGTAKIFSWRGVTKGVGLNENGWGFGQIVPLLMLLQPLMALPELFSDSKTENPETDRSNSSSGTSLPETHTPRSPQVRMPSSGENAQKSPVAQPMQPMVPLTFDDSQENHHIARADTMHVLQNQTRIPPTPTQGSRDLLPWRYDIYASRWFGTLLSTIMVLVSGYFLVIVVLQALGPELAGLQAGGEILLSSVGLAYFVALPVSLAFYLWFQLAIIFSSIWAPVRHIKRR